MSARMSVRPASNAARNPSPRSSRARAITASMYRSLSPPSGSSLRQAAQHDGGGAPERVALRRVQSRGHRAHVVAAVAVRGEGQRFAAQLEIAQPHARREDVHLPACVVHVVLAVHAPAVGLEQVRDASPRKLRGARGRRAAGRSGSRRRTRRSCGGRRRRCRGRSARPRRARGPSRPARRRGVMKKLMKPGPAISVFATRSFAGIAATIASASLRGFVRAAFARRIATPVAKSPWAVSRLRSIAGSGASASPSVPGGSAAIASFTSCSMRFFKRAILSNARSNRLPRDRRRATSAAVAAPSAPRSRATQAARKACSAPRDGDSTRSCAR